MSTLAIARIRALECLRDPFFWALVGAGVLLSALAPHLVMFEFDPDLRLVMIRDFILAAVLLFGLFYILFAASRTLREEIENRTALAILTRPVSRTAYLAGTYLGALSSLLVLTEILAAGLGVVLFLERAFGPPWARHGGGLRLAGGLSRTLDLAASFGGFAEIAVPCALAFLVLAVMLACALVLSLLLPRAAAMFATILVLLAGSLGPVLPAGPAAVAHLVLPDVTLLMGETYTHPAGGVLLRAAAYAVLFVCFLLTAGGCILSRKDLG